MKGLPYEVKSLVQKSRESAILAVETYNRPSATFRSGAYAVLMVIAWTSLFHAICLRNKVKPFYRKHGTRRYIKIDGRAKRWELGECVNQHYKDSNPSVRKNLEFFIGLRNRIEHCTLAELDPEIFGECQALLLNFESMLITEFGERYAINGGLSFAIQFGKSVSRTLSVETGQARRRTYREVKQYVDTFRSALATDVQSDLQYSFKVFLVPKIGNHATSDSVAIEFVKFDPSKPVEMEKHEKLLAMIKPKEVGVANQGLLKPSQVVAEVSKQLNRPFSQFDHRLCFTHFGVRPSGSTQTPAACDSRYCQYDAVHKDYCYQPSWVDFLVTKLTDPATYELVVKSKKKCG